MGPDGGGADPDELNPLVFGGTVSTMVLLG